MSDYDDDITLRQILDHAREAYEFVQGMDEATFINDRLRYLAVTRLISIVGEAATRLSPEKREELPQIPWRQIIGFRNILIHLYHRVDDPTLWQVLMTDIPQLIEDLDRLNLPEEAE